MKQLFEKYKDIISYLVFGVLTTLVNIIFYWLCAHLLHLSTVLSAAIAWLAAIIFAYLTNRKFVFHSKAIKKKDILIEVITFFVCRLLTGLLDVVIMHVFVDKFGQPDMIVKIISNIIVILANYVFSKLVIFKADDQKETIKKSILYSKNKH